MHSHVFNGPFPDNESGRLRAIGNCQLADSDEDPQIELMVELAQGHFGTKVALLSIVEAQEQWFKVVRGIDVHSTPRALSFCTHTILKDETLVVNDASVHPLFKDNLLVTEAPHIRFYAGAPITLHGRYNIGTICMIDDKPRRYVAASDRCFLMTAAGIIAALIERRMPYLEYTP